MAGSDGWTPAELPSMDDRTVIVTGANTGIGYEGSKALAAAGATVVMACRSVERGEGARAEIESEVPGADCEVRECDLADLTSVESFVDGFLDGHDDLHVLCNNAGVMAIPRRETVDGNEYQFGVNHLGHFALTGHLLGTLRETGREGDEPARVVTQSSNLHRRGRIAFDDLQRERSYDPWDAYGQSKLGNLLFAYELDRRLDAAGADVTSVGCHPGYADTDLQRRGPEMRGSRLRLWAMRVANALFAQSAERGAWPMLYGATAEAVDGGDYVGPGGLMDMRGHPEEQRSSDRSYDRGAARRLWAVSEALTGVEYDLPAPEWEADE